MFGFVALASSVILVGFSTSPPVGLLLLQCFDVPQLSVTSHGVSHVWVCSFLLVLVLLDTSVTYNFHTTFTTLAVESGPWARSFPCMGMQLLAVLCVFSAQVHKLGLLLLQAFSLTFQPLLVNLGFIINLTHLFVTIFSSCNHPLFAHDFHIAMVDFPVI